MASAKANCSERSTHCDLINACCGIVGLTLSDEVKLILTAHEDTITFSLILATTKKIKHINMIMIQCPDVVCNVTDHINVKKTLAVWYDLFYVLSVQNRIKYDLCKKITIRYTL